MHYIIEKQGPNGWVSVKDDGGKRCEYKHLGNAQMVRFLSQSGNLKTRICKVKHTKGGSEIVTPLEQQAGL